MFECVHIVFFDAESFEEVSSARDWHRSCVEVLSLQQRLVINILMKLVTSITS